LLLLQLARFHCVYQASGEDFMRRSIALALALAAAPVAVSATEVPAPLLSQPQLQQPATPATLPHAQTIRVPDRVEQHRAASEVAAVRQPDRRNWWWLVGAIVVGGLIVALLV
jgi:hypothetical protein